MAADLYSLYMDDEPTAQEKAQALAQALGRQRDVGQLAMLTGDKVLGPLGQTLFGDASKQQAQLGEVAGSRLQRALQARQMEQAQRRIDQQDELLGLRAREVGATYDAYGNPILYNKHGGTGPVASPAGTATAPTGGGGGGAGGMLTPAARRQLAEMFRRTGTIPPVGRGKAAPAIIAGIVNEAAAMDPEADLAGNKAAYKADTTSLGKQQQLYDLTKSWESTGRANLANLKRISLRIANSGSPWLNKPVRAFAQGMGDPDMIAFRAAHSAVVNEYAKILSGNTGGGGITEGARAEAEHMLPLDSTPEQLAAAIDVLEQDAGNRLGYLKAQLDETKARTQGKAQPAKEEAPAAPVRRFKRVNGKLVEDK